MKRLVQTVALAAALVSLGVSLYRADPLWTACKRMLLAYLAFFFVTALLALAYRAGAQAEARARAAAQAAAAANAARAAAKPKEGAPRPS
jgi:hypothetical protein